MSTVGTKKVMILLLWEKNFEYKNPIFFSDVCYDLSLWWHLPNLDIAFKQIKTVKITKNNLACCFRSYHIYWPGTNVLYALIYICLQSCTATVFHTLPFMANIRHSYGFGYILIVIRCIIYISGTRFSMWIQLWCQFVNWTNLIW